MATLNPIEQGFIAGAPAPVNPLTLGNIKPVKTVNNANLPVNKTDSSNFTTQITALQAQIKQLQSSQQPTNTPPTDATITPPSSSATDSITNQLTALEGQQKTTQDQVTAAEQGNDPNQKAIMANEAAIAQAGLTPEKYQQLQDTSSKMIAIQSQLSDLDLKYQQDVQNAQAQTGMTQDESAAQISGITRDYQKTKADLTSKGNLLGLIAASLQGNWDAANTAAQDYVKNSTAVQQQKITDLQNGFSNYASIITAMTTKEQAIIQNQFNDQMKILTIQSRDAQNTILDTIRQQNANTASARLNLGQQIKFTNGQKLQLGSYGLSQDNVNAIESYLQQGNSIDTITGLTDLQKQGLQQVMGGTQAKTIASDTMSSDITQIQTDKGDPSTWTQAQWTQNLNDFVSKYPDNTTLAKQQFTNNFPKPAAPKTLTSDPLGYLGSGFKSLFGGLLPK